MLQAKGSNVVSRIREPMQNTLLLSSRRELITPFDDIPPLGLELSESQACRRDSLHQFRDGTLNRIRSLLQIAYDLCDPWKRWVFARKR
jgi:hypothetical protein